MLRLTYLVKNKEAVEKKIRQEIWVKMTCGLPLLVRV